MNTVLLIAVVLFLVMITQLIRSNRKFKRQTKVLSIQGQEIEKRIKELQAQNNLLQDLNKEKQQIIGVVSHDLKGPFNRIFALIQLMSHEEKNLTADQKDYLGKIHQIVADGLGMVRNLLDNRRLEDKGLELLLESINISATVSGIVKNYRVLSEKKRIEILFETPIQMMALADKIYLNRIMDNLMTNAIKFSVPDHRVWVSLKENPKTVEIHVKDEGPGLSREDETKLYQKYQRLTPRPTAGESTTGLGLYLVQAMVTKMGGTVTCFSELGKGTEFVVTLRRSIN
jgi:two-component system, sensor histidine kinase and response regulator